jgi:hypothetical protein
LLIFRPKAIGIEMPNDADSVTDATARLHVLEQKKPPRTWAAWADDVVIPWIRFTAGELDRKPPPGPVIIAGPGSTVNHGVINFDVGTKIVNYAPPEEKK